MVAEGCTNGWLWVVLMRLGSDLGGVDEGL